MGTRLDKNTLTILKKKIKDHQQELSPKIIHKRLASVKSHIQNLGWSDLKTRQTNSLDVHV